MTNESDTILIDNLRCRVTEGNGELIVHTYGIGIILTEMLVTPLILVSVIFFGLGLQQDGGILTDTQAVVLFFILGLACILLPRKLYRGRMPTDIITRWNLNTQNVTIEPASSSRANQWPLSQTPISVGVFLRSSRHRAQYTEWRFSCSIQGNPTTIIRTEIRTEAAATKKALERIGATLCVDEQM